MDKRASVWIKSIDETSVAKVAATLLPEIQREPRAWREDRAFPIGRWGLASLTLRRGSASTTLRRVVETVEGETRETGDWEVAAGDDAPQPADWKKVDVYLKRLLDIKVTDYLEELPPDVDFETRLELQTADEGGLTRGWVIQGPFDDSFIVTDDGRPVHLRIRADIVDGIWIEAEELRKEAGTEAGTEVGTEEAPPPKG